MGYFSKQTITIASNTAATTTLTKSVNGQLYGVHMTQSAVQLDSSALVSIYRGATTEPVILKIAPTTLVDKEYFPRSQIHTSTGAVLAPSTVMFWGGICHALANDYLRVVVGITSAASTAGGSQGQTASLEFLIQGAG